MPEEESLCSHDGKCTIRKNIIALLAFVARKLGIDAMLQRLTELSANHFEVDPEDFGWGHFGTFGHYHRLLRQVCDSVFHEGDHAA